MLCLKDCYKILAWPKFYHYVCSQLPFYSAIDIGTLFVLFLNPDQVTIDPYQLAYDIYQADSIDPWAVNELNIAGSKAINTKFSMVQLGYFVKKLRLQSKEQGRKLVRDNAHRLHELYKDLMNEGLKVAQGVNKNDVK